MSGPGNGLAVNDDPFEHDDASYLLGALSGANRAGFEAHLPDCAACAARVAALRPVAGALASGGDAVRDALAASLVAVAEPSTADTTPAARASRITGLARMIERRRRRIRWAFGGLAIAAVAAIAALSVALAAPASPATAGAQTGTTTAAGSTIAAGARQMTAVAASAIHATAAITAAPWGSEITVDCSYSGAWRYASGNVYALQVVDRSGRTQDIGSWSLGPSAQVRFVGGTALAPGQIRAVDVIEPDGTVLLRLSV
jgi:anti-sigma factor RsiW